VVALKLFHSPIATVDIV